MLEVQTLLSNLHIYYELLQHLQTPVAAPPTYLSTIQTHFSGFTLETYIFTKLSPGDEVFFFSLRAE